MAVYEYLCPKCRNQFELMRPMGEAEKPARCPKCGSKAQKLISGFGSKTGDSILSAGEPFREGEVDSPNRLTLSSDPAEDAKLLPASGHFGSRGSLRRRDMAQTSLLQQLEEVASKIRLLERAKGEAVARMEALEREKRRGRC